MRICTMTNRSAEIANARLIAAAPDLLAALEEIEGLLDCGNIEQSHWDDCLRISRSAKAKGTL